MLVAYVFSLRVSRTGAVLPVQKAVYVCVKQYKTVA